MEVENHVPRPRASLINLLLHQLEKQSEVCNLTVKVGQWEKNFHRCVLTASPFFENAINGNFLEKRRGIVEISVVKAQYVEMAIMFLYGEEPDLTIDTVGDLLEIAEFLMIKRLKYVCIRWLRHLHITLENCMHVLQISSLFDFEVANCIEYIESHLSEVIMEKGAMNLTTNCVLYLFSDPTFSYVTMDERLKFLVKWFIKHPEVRKQNVKDLFKTIDLSEVSQSVWKDTKSVSSFNEAVDLDQAVRVPEDEKAGRNVLIMAGANDLIWCLDFKKNQWYKVKSDCIKKTTFLGVEGIKNITGIKQIRNSCSEIFFGSKLFSQVTTSNLETNETITYSLISIDKDRERFSSIKVKNNTVFACGNNTYYKEKTIHPASSQQLGPQKRNIFMIRSVLYKGYLSRQNVKMTPILSLLNDEIYNICIGYSSVALLLRSKQVIIFDSALYQMEQIDLVLDMNDTIVRYKDGFLIFNNKRCHCLSKLRGPSLSKKYLLKEIELENEKMWYLRYIFSRGIWLRLMRRDRTDDLKLQYVFHQTLIASKSPRGVQWKVLSMPQEIEGFCLQIMRTNLFLVCLSKNKSRCRIVCPHCGPSKTQKKVDGWHDNSNYNRFIYSRDYEDQIYSRNRMNHMCNSECNYSLRQHSDNNVE